MMRPYLDLFLIMVVRLETVIQCPEVEYMSDKPPKVSEEQLPWTYVRPWMDAMSCVDTIATTVKQWWQCHASMTLSEIRI